MNIEYNDNQETTIIAIIYISHNLTYHHPYHHLVVYFIISYHILSNVIIMAAFDFIYQSPLPTISMMQLQ